MAETPQAGKLKWIRIPRFLVPKKVLQDMELLFGKARIAFSATEWMGIFAAGGIMLLILASLLLSPFVGAGLFIASQLAMLMIPRIQADKRKSSVEATLPDVLHHMSVSIRTGLVLESVIKEISEADYGPLSEEFAQIVVEMRRGRSLKEAMLAFSDRVGSKAVGRSMRLLLEGVEFGGPISDVLDEVSEDMRAVRMIQRERKTMTSQQVSFLAMASLMAGPFVMGVVAALPTIMANMIGDIGGAEDLPLDDVNKVVDALTFYVFAQAASGGLMIAVIMYGDMKKGIKFMLPLGIVAYIVFAAVKFIMPKAVTLF